MKKIDYFPQYYKLTFFERKILDVCCFYPPKPKRVRGLEVDLDINKYTFLTKKSFGNNIFEELENKKVLDFGCGEAGFSLAIALNAKNSVVDGIDIINGFEKAKNIIKAENINNVNLIEGYSSILPDSIYDYIISHDSFEHFEDPEYILSEMFRLVKPNGYILIKFGPTWMNPYGRHMSGTFKKSFPWLHLFVSEKSMMRIHSVYHNSVKLYENYKDLEGGLNKMTIKKALKILNSFQAQIVNKKISYILKGKIFKDIPLLNELFSSSLYLKIKKVV